MRANVWSEITPNRVAADPLVRTAKKGKRAQMDQKEPRTIGPGLFAPRVPASAACCPRSSGPASAEALDAAAGPADDLAVQDVPQVAATAGDPQEEPSAGPVRSAVALKAVRCAPLDLAG